MIRIDAIFKGQVQGVGFRYTAQETAERLGLVGWVKNLDDGDVKAIVEGEESMVEEFVRAMEGRFTVRETLIARSRPTGKYSVFAILPSGGPSYE